MSERDYTVVYVGDERNEFDSEDEARDFYYRMVRVYCNQVVAWGLK